MKRLLLHACCANCLAYPFLNLSKKFVVSIFFYNPNIFPYEEYRKRLLCVEEFARIYEAELIIGAYDGDFFIESVKGYEKEKEGFKRCDICFSLRLSKTKTIASSNGFDLFATTLSVSPHKNAQNINKAGACLSDENTKFYQADFKKHNGYRITNSISKSFHFYRQNYCGCRFGIEE